MSEKEFYNNTYEAEQAVLGALIQSKDARDEIATTLEANDFYEKKHQIIFQAISDLISLGVEVDVPTLVSQLDTTMKVLDKIGGVKYIYELGEAYLGDINAFYHVRIIKDASLSRKLIQTMQGCIDGFKKEKIKDVSQYVADCENKILAITQARRVAEFVTANEVVSKVTNKLKIEKNDEKKSRYCVGITTGYDTLDRYTQGWQKGSLIILAARPSVGKTALAINLIFNAANIENRPVAFFSLEMDAESICRRLISSVAGINSTFLTTGNLNTDDWLALDIASSKLKKTQIFIDDTSAQKLNDIRTKSKKLKASHPDLGAIFIDYLGLITTNAKLGEVSKSIEVGEISRSLKSLARELNVPVICLSQLSRANEKGSRQPILSDLRDSGSIEQDADQVIFIYREDYQKPEKQQEEQKNNPNADGDGPFDVDKQTKIIIAKNRNGKVGTIELHFMMNIGRFIEIDGKQEE